MHEAKVKGCDDAVQPSKRQALAAEAAMQNTQQQLQVGPTLTHCFVAPTQLHAAAAVICKSNMTQAVTA